MLLIKNGHVKPMVGEDIENGYVLIGDGAQDRFGRQGDR